MLRGFQVRPASLVSNSVCLVPKRKPGNHHHNKPMMSLTQHIEQEPQPIYIQPQSIVLQPAPHIWIAPELPPRIPLRESPNFPPGSNPPWAFQPHQNRLKNTSKPLQHSGYVILEWKRACKMGILNASFVIISSYILSNVHSFKGIESRWRVWIRRQRPPYSIKSPEFIQNFPMRLAITNASFVTIRSNILFKVYSFRGTENRWRGRLTRQRAPYSKTLPEFIKTSSTSLGILTAGFVSYTLSNVYSFKGIENRWRRWISKAAKRYQNLP